ncbi:probable G-protein coupled receptor 83 [Stylophora pistillata]|uniref:probable G-protein coupled receptor 83 n=1 Tax=Stylophora pistillata TaxID=50429 RepID=UPI000C039BF7|nr:probable G-protein coupled receptor 83 [Stylophora pistillata]
MDSSNVTNNNTFENGTSKPDLFCSSASPNTDLSKALKTISFCFIILASLFGNTLVILVVYKKKRMRTTTNIIIVNMAVSDMIFAVFTTPPSIRTIYVGDYLLVRGITADLICKLVTFIQQASLAVSILSLTAIAFDRFFAILFPFRKIINRRTTKVLVALTWLVGAVFTAPILYTNRTVVDDGSNKVTCQEVWEPLFNSSKARSDYTFVHFGFLYAGPLTVIGVLYTAIVLELWRGNSVKFRAKANYQEVEKSNKKVLKMLVTVIVVFALFWLPVYIFQFLVYTGNRTCTVDGVILFIGYFLCQATSAVNPFIYAIYSENYRSGFKAVLRNLVYCQGRQLFRRESSRGESLSVRREKKVELYFL